MVNDTTEFNEALPPLMTSSSISPMSRSSRSRLGLMPRMNTCVA